MTSSGRIVLFGATGYTGALTAAALVGAGTRPVLAGRRRDRLTALAGSLGGDLPTAVADVADPATLRALLEPGDVLVSTVGPFGRYGSVAVQAALDAGAHYLDSTGEAPFIREVFDRYGPAAPGTALLTAFGYDYVPGNLAGALALERAPGAAAVHVGYFLTGAASGGMSSGTAASSVGIALGAQHVLRSGRLVLEPLGRHVRAFGVDGRDREAASIGGTEPLTLPRLHPQVRDVVAYVGWFGRWTRPVAVATAGMSALRRLPGADRLVSAAAGALTPRATGTGPDAATRSGRRSRVVAVCTDEAGRALSRVELDGPDGYDLTAGLLAWGAQRLAAGEVRGSGALGPVDGFGLSTLTAGAAALGLVPV